MSEITDALHEVVGMEAERTAVVKWLREQSAGFRSSGGIPVGDFISQLAHRIERADHLTNGDRP